MTVFRLPLAGLVAALALASALTGGAGAAAGPPPPGARLRTVLEAGGLTYASGMIDPVGDYVYVSLRVTNPSVGVVRTAVELGSMRRTLAYATIYRTSPSTRHTFERAVAKSMPGWKHFTLRRVRTWHTYLVLDVKIQR
jgi:hypothetical protein